MHEAASMQLRIQSCRCTDARLSAAILAPGVRGSVTQGTPANRRIQERLLLGVQGSSIPWNYLIKLNLQLKEGAVNFGRAG